MTAVTKPGRGGVRQIVKYLAVGRMGFATAVAYRGEHLLRTAFLVLILYAFAVLWRTVYGASQAQVIEGFTLPAMIWYLVITEAIVFSRPRLAGRIDTEVKSGTLAYTLVRPYSYIMFHYAQSLGEALARGLMSFMVGGVTVSLLIGPPPFNVANIGFFAVALWLGATIDFLLTFAVGLLAFWIEETSPLAFIQDRLLMLLGGMMLPLEVFPAVLRTIAGWLPLSMIIYAPARLLVGATTLKPWPVLMAQVAWLAVAAVVCSATFRAGVKRVNVHGG